MTGDTTRRRYAGSASDRQTGRMDYSKLIGTNSNAAVPPAEHVLLTADTHQSRHLKGTRALNAVGKKSATFHDHRNVSVVQGTQGQVLRIINVVIKIPPSKRRATNLSQTFEQTTPKGAQATYCRGKISDHCKEMHGQSKNREPDQKSLRIQHNHHKSHLKKASRIFARTFNTNVT